MDDGAGQVDDGAGQSDDGSGQSGWTGQLDEGSGQLDDGAGQVDDGAGQVDDGAGQSDDGSGQLEEAVKVGGTGPHEPRRAAWICRPGARLGRVRVPTPQKVPRACNHPPLFLSSPEKAGAVLGKGALDWPPVISCVTAAHSEVQDVTRS